MTTSRSLRDTVRDLSSPTRYSLVHDARFDHVIVPGGTSRPVKVASSENATVYGLCVDHRSVCRRTAVGGHVHSEHVPGPADLRARAAARSPRTGELGNRTR